ncbi:hypothetical protein BJY04DRAFT_39723 [Aspergillus karnatakaensis]|uniref:uncharacterized protein n=1 Tax=Aspergillus karnatakaensis TaxID=1810916 RepID=UPI003CCD1E37
MAESKGFEDTSETIAPLHGTIGISRDDSTWRNTNTEKSEAISVPKPRCKCVIGDDDARTQSSAIGMTYDSKLTLAAGASRPQPLTLHSENSLLPHPRGRTPHRIPSLPEHTSQRSPLQAQSPASLIFERSVQEDILLPQTSPSIPSHIRTENHIPPVLEASSVAITDGALDPDSVEIITHAIHQPAVGGIPGEQSLQSPSPDHIALDAGYTEEPALNSQHPDANDIRRLSFISFADVVHAENAETSECASSNDLVQKGTSSPTALATVYRNVSPSPLHSPVSSHGVGTSPPTSISTSFKGLELSPNRGPRGAESPRLAVERPVSPGFSGEINIETMRQALRRTGSGDLGAS